MIKTRDGIWDHVHISGYIGPEAAKVHIWNYMDNHIV